jgi:hypothetical protein
MTSGTGINIAIGRNGALFKTTGTWGTRILLAMFR